MFVIPPILAMLAFIYIRPQEVWETMQVITFPIILGLGLLGYVLDLRLGVTRAPKISPFLAFGFVFFAWALLTIGINAPDALVLNITFFFGPIGLLFFISQGVQTIRGFRFVSRTLLVVTLAIAVIAIHQGMRPEVCLIDNTGFGDAALPIVEGRPQMIPCKERMDCSEAIGYEQDYFCEHWGVMGTTSVEGRVRYRGVFQDPNELAFAMSLSLPFAFGWFEGRRRRGRNWAGIAVVVVALAICVTCNIMTRSRSGQISLIATLGVYFLRRFRWRGGVLAAIVAMPVLLLGGRSAESSTQERLECWAEALALWREHPIFGAGARQFTAHHHLTAHNSVLLALADMGPIGLLVFTCVIYMAFKITLQVQNDFAGRPDAAEVRGVAFATLAGMVGLVSSALFLSLTYHVALWIEVGLVGAVQSIVWRHEPNWRLRWRWRDVGYVIVMDVLLIVAIAIYLRAKGYEA